MLNAELIHFASQNLEHIQLGQDLCQNITGKSLSWEEWHSSFILTAKFSSKVCVEGVKSIHLSSEFCSLPSAEWLWRHLVTLGCFVKFRHVAFKRKNESQTEETSAFQLKFGIFFLLLLFSKSINSFSKQITQNKCNSSPPTPPIPKQMSNRKYDEKDNRKRLIFLRISNKYFYWDKFQNNIKNTMGVSEIHFLLFTFEIFSNMNWQTI